MGLDQLKSIPTCILYWISSCWNFYGHKFSELKAYCLWKQTLWTNSWHNTITKFLGHLKTNYQHMMEYSMKYDKCWGQRTCSRLESSYQYRTNINIPCKWVQGQTIYDWLAIQIIDYLNTKRKLRKWNYLP